MEQVKIQVIETKESDGDWIRVKVNDSTIACLGFGEGKRTLEEALTRANEIAMFYWENGGKPKVHKEFEVKEV